MNENSNEEIQNEQEFNIPQKPRAIKHRQWRNTSIIVLFALFVFYLLYSFIAGGAKNATDIEQQEKTKETKIEFTNPAESDKNKSLLMDRIQSRLQKTEKDNLAIAEEIKRFEEQGQNHQNELQDIKEQMSNLGQQIEERQEMSGDNSGGVFPQTVSANPPEPIPEPQIRIDKFFNASTDQIKTAINYVPSGTFVKAIMLGGADVAAGAMSQSDPSPMLFRILENGTLPNHRFSTLRNCLVTAAVVGDISSETGKIRLERMSCTRPDGQVLDLAVEGTVFGSSGKNGIRGNPVWREGDLLQRAFVAGTLSGLSNGMSQKYTTDSVSPLGTTQTVNSIFKYGATQGIGKAMDRLAEYNIHRAEQYHPVIQLSAGAIVDIVFLKGFSLSETSEQNFARESNQEQPITTNEVSQSTDISEQAAQNSLQRMQGNA